MKLRSLGQWLFVYLPVRFTVPFLALLAWYLFYLWPWLLELFFPANPQNDIRDKIRTTIIDQFLPKQLIDELNLGPAVDAAGVLLLLLAGILIVYNIAALIYQLDRRWPREKFLVATLLLNTFIYSYPWIFAPKDWSELRIFGMPYYLREPWIDGFSRYGVLWLMPGIVMLGTLVNELIFRRKAATEPPAIASMRGGELSPVENKTFEKLVKSDDLRIGLILSGGGAKGVYQAGAMKAIHEFLENYGALGKVKMIAGTSIGSWNSTFWLADLVGAPPGKMSVHEQWWQTANVSRLIEFDKYIPFMQNSMLRNRPWRENFEEVFAKTALPSVLQNKDAIHFYLTRSHVAQGRLEFSTNWDAKARERALRSDDIEIDSFIEARTIDAVREAVFASMDLPPLFPYQQMGYEYFEDGGVIDNLPIRFGTLVEDCDILFVLALNASFEEVPSQHSLLQRLARVTDVRQGVLERNSMRLVYLYNHINHLRGQHASAAVKTDKLVKVFAICPEQPLAVNTSEFWKTDRFGAAFNVMYQATRVELSRFNFEILPKVASDDHKDWLRMALVSPAGEITYNYRF